ncbi:MAG: ABC transporter ATP-binding protein [Gaiellaceae bacterium]
MTSLVLAEVSVEFDGARVLDRVSLSVAGGEWLGLIGPNGAGKTSLLRAVARLVPHTGSITLRGELLERMGRRATARRIAVVPQNPVTPPDLTVVEYVLLGRTPYIPYAGGAGRSDLAAVERALSALELTEFARRPLGSLSGGERQRVVLARALAQDAPLLLLDEPTSALDVGRQQQVLELVESLRREHELTVVSATHELTLAGQYADRLVLLDAGRHVASGAPREVLRHELIARHYGASVRIVEDETGIAVVPVRPAPQPVEAGLA